MNATPCPTCKGTGRMTVQVTGVDVGSVAITCLTCDGTGAPTARQLADLAAERAMWCRCAAQDEEPDVRFHDDGQCRKRTHPRKHHYDCGHCGGVLQVG